MAAALDPASDSGYLQRFHYEGDYSAQQIFAAHLQWGRRHIKSLATRGDFPSSRDPHRRINVAYVSSDLRRHPVGYCVEAFLPESDPKQFNVAIFSGVGVGDDLTARLRSLPVRWHDIEQWTSDELVREVRSQQIDICVDLSGHTPGNRMPAFGQRMAPIQVSWLGYWNTTGVGAMDYYLAGAHEFDAADQRYFTERIVQLPGGRTCLVPPDDLPQVGSLPADRRGFVTFASFANRTIDRRVASCWRRILQLQPRSRLVLGGNSYNDVDKVKAALELLCSGEDAIDRGRIDFKLPVPRRQFFESLNEIDILLDPFPFSGLQSSLDCLIMGVPAVSMYSARIDSRQTSGLLRNLGLGRLTARNVDEYVSAAVCLSRDISALRQIRENLRSDALKAFCNGRAFCRGLEAEFRKMWEEFCTLP
jgi:predicted O-linked N-acetylglucosamine transferase (SPINDLY family)